MREAISGHQRSSAVISSHHGSSWVISGHRRSSAVITSSGLIRAHQRSSRRAHQGSSGLIRAHQGSSSGLIIRAHQGRAHLQEELIARRPGREHARRPRAALEHALRDEELAHLWGRVRRRGERMHARERSHERMHELGAREPSRAHACTHACARPTSLRTSSSAMVVGAPRAARIAPSRASVS
jgi:hypothetical protein